MATFSITDIQTFKRCRRKWNWSSNARMNLAPRGAGAPALELGSLVHRTLAAWMVDKHANDAILDQLFLQQANARVEEIKVAYLSKIGALISEQELEPIYDIVLLGKAMMANYQTYWKEPVPPEMRFASAEQEIIVPVPGTEHACPECIKHNTIWEQFYFDANKLVIPANANCKLCNGTGVATHFISATLDGLLQNKRDWLFVLERKTFSPRYRPTTIGLKMADQFTGYAWVVSQLGIGRVAGIAYDGMAKQEKPTRGKDVDTLFLRTNIPKSEDEIAEWGKHAAEVVNDMANSPAIYPNVPWDGCEHDCSFITPCTMQLLGEDNTAVINTQYVQREVIRIQGIRNEVQ